jgi:hypothetical protein
LITSFCTSSAFTSSSLRPCCGSLGAPEDVSRASSVVPPPLLATIKKTSPRTTSTNRTMVVRKFMMKRMKI